MGYNNPNDQYKIAKAPEMIKELQGTQHCDGSTVMSYKSISFGGGNHAGTLSHLCGLAKDHKDMCECKNCGAKFYKIG